MTKSNAAPVPQRNFRKLLAIAFILLGVAVATWLWLRRAPQPEFADVSYAQQSDTQKLDIYLPSGKGPFPVVFYIHGGGFEIGDKQDSFGDFKGNIDAMKAANIALVSINYRKSGEAVFPAAVQDVKSAVRFVRANATKYRIDPAKIGLWGKSAGGNLALMAGLAPGKGEFSDAAALKSGTSDQVSAIISMFGPTDFADMDAQLRANGCAESYLTHNNADSPESKYLGRQISLIPDVVARSNPIEYLNPDSPRLLLLHGEKDCTVPPEQSVTLAKAAAKIMTAASVSIRIVAGAGHGDSQFDNPATMNELVAFLHAAFAREQSQKSIK